MPTPKAPRRRTTRHATPPKSSIKTRPFREVNISHASTQTGRRRFPPRGLEDRPDAAPWRMNLTAFSQYRNLLFIAYGESIHVYQPASSTQTLGSKIYAWRVPDSGSMRSGRILVNHPHFINHLVVGDYGNDEVIATAHDEGDFLVVTVESVCRAIAAYSAGELDAQACAAKYMNYVVHRNAWASAWGVAIHKEARLTAVSTNLKEISVFAPALTAISLPEARWRATDMVLCLQGHEYNIPSIAFCNTGGDPYGRWLVSTDIRGSVFIWDVWRHCGLRRINLVPGVPDAQATLGWAVMLLDSCDFTVADTNEELLGFDPEGPLDPKLPIDVSRGRRSVRDSALMYADGLEHEIPSSARPVRDRPGGLPPPSYYDSDFDDDADEEVDGEEDGWEDVSGDGNDPEHEAEESVEQDQEAEELVASDSESSVSSEGRDLPSEPQLELDQDMLAAHVPRDWMAFRAAREEGNLPLTGHVDPYARQDFIRMDPDPLALMTGNQYLTATRHGYRPRSRQWNCSSMATDLPNGYVRLNYPPHMATESRTEFRGVSRMHEWHPSSDITDAAPAPPLRPPASDLPFSILHAGADVVTLLRPPFDNTASFCVEPCLQDLPRHMMSLNRYDRLNLTCSIPALGVVVLATQSGRAAVFTLTKDNRSDKAAHTMRLDWLLPFTSQEKRGERPNAPLMGIAAAPMQANWEGAEATRRLFWRSVDGARGGGGGFGRGVGGGRRRTGRRNGLDMAGSGSARFRLMLIYLDHTVMSYELWRDEGVSNSEGLDGLQGERRNWDSRRYEIRSLQRATEDWI